MGYLTNKCNGAMSTAPIIPGGESITIIQGVQDGESIASNKRNDLVPIVALTTLAVLGVIGALAVLRSRGATGLTAFGYVFDNRTPAQSIAVGSDVLFNSNGPLQLVTHTLGTSSIVVTLAGIYNIEFAIYTVGNTTQQWGIAVNGVVQSVFQASGETLNASAKLSLNASDIVSIRNVATVPNPASLRPGVISAWVQIDKVN